MIKFENFIESCSGAMVAGSFFIAVINEAQVQEASSSGELLRERFVLAGSPQLPRAPCPGHVHTGVVGSRNGKFMDFQFV
ncbi:hypothetical protein D3C80_1733650 [compost metagenome]